jgi:hypothetical protein
VIHLIETLNWIVLQVHERIRGEFYHHHTDAHKHVTKQAKVWGFPRGGAANISLVDAEELAGRR